MRENAFLLDVSLMDMRLAEWIERECGLEDLAKELYPIIRKHGSLSAFVSIILEYVGLYGDDVIREVERVLKEGSGLSGLQKRKNQVDYLVRKGKYGEALRQYNDLLTKWEEENQGEGTCGKDVKAAILHNKGVALAALLEYAQAAECFREAFTLTSEEIHYRNYLAAKRMELDEEAYVSFLADGMENYEGLLALEKRIEEIEQEFKQDEAWHKLSLLKEWRGGNQKQMYYDEVETITQALKDGYRDSVEE